LSGDENFSVRKENNNWGGVNSFIERDSQGKANLYDYFKKILKNNNNINNNYCS